MNQFVFLNAEVLDEKVSKIKNLWEDFYPIALDYLLNIAISIVIYFIGKKVIKLLLRIVRKAFERSKMDSGAESFLLSFIRVLSHGVLFIIIAKRLFGLQTTSFVALLGSAGLTIGFALQGSLSNFAGGVLLLILKPFRVGDYIIAFGNEGTVTAVDIFYTKILTIDNKLIVFPNGTLSNSNIVNVTNEPERRLDLTIPIGYSDDIRLVKDVLQQICADNELILKDKSTDIFVFGLGEDSMEMAVRVWVETDSYLLVRSQLLESIKYAFDEKGFTIPFRHMDVTVKSVEQK